MSMYQEDTEVTLKHLILADSGKINKRAKKDSSAIKRKIK